MHTEDKQHNYKSVVVDIVLNGPGEFLGSRTSDDHSDEYMRGVLDVMTYLIKNAYDPDTAILVSDIFKKNNIESSKNIPQK